MNFTEDVLPILLTLGLALLIAVPVIVVVRGAFRRHDPARAAASVELDGPGEFRLEIPKGSGGSLYFRFEIDGDTDNEYDLVVRGTIERASGAARRFAWRTRERSSVEGAAEAEKVTTTNAVTVTTGSFELGGVDAGAVVVGSVSEGTPGLLKRGWVYLPKDG